MEMYGGVEVNCHTFLTLATSGGNIKGFFIPVNSVQGKVRKEFKKLQLTAIRTLYMFCQIFM